MPLPFNKTLDLKLIKLVKDNPIIYNSTHPKHLDFDAREVVWQKIGDALSRPAVQFAGIQCQVHYGDFQEDKHKPGFFENLNEYLPEQYSGSWGVEKKILREFAKHQGLGQLEAKHQYTKTARDLPTYGVTFFLVKEKMKGKKKLVPRLLGINAESILRLDETTKEILQVWPLTQVKTYHAGKAETFTLDFGDYSDKEYSVKTNDAHRIRDILQGYIDIIRKRMEANYNLRHTEHHAICEDNVHADRGHIMTHIEHNSSKAVEETFVGPSKIITYEPGKAIAQGTQIMTVQQMVVTNKGGNQQTVVLGEVPMRKDMSMDFVRKLNRLNSNSVKIVTLLTDPSEHNVSEAAKIVDIMEADMPSITEGVKETADKKSSEEAKKKLLSELQELRDCMKALVDATDVHHNPEEAEEAAKRIADLSTQMFFSLDPAMQKRGKFCRESRKSFIHDDAVDASLRRASYLAAARGVSATIFQARAQLDQKYRGPLLGAADVDDLEKAAADKMDKLNAAVALYLTAYADPKNTDYAAAVTSINTMHELLPELVNDGIALGSVKDGKNREELLDAIRSLCDAMASVCLAADPDDHQKMHDNVKEYSKISDRLLFTFRRGRSVDKQNEIIELAKVAGEKASLLLMKANELAGRVPDAEAAMLDDAGVRCADTAQDLITCATLTAPSIHEPHCQSALTAAAEALSSSAQHLAVTWKPLVEDPARKVFGEDLRDRTMDLAKALDKLKGAFAGLDGVEEEPNEVRANRRLKFVTSVADAKNRMDAAEAELDAPVENGPQKQTEEELRRRLAQRMAQLNAALAALVAASADRDKPDYTTAEIAVSTIGELMPDIVKDGKLLSANADEDAREQMLAELRALCHSTRAIYYSADSGDMDDLNKLASKVGASSGRLCFKFNPHSGRGPEQQILDLASSANDKASQLLDEVEGVAKKMGGQAGTELETARLKTADAAGALQTAAQLTAPSIQDPRCQACLVASANTLASASQRLAAAWAQPGLQEAKTLEELRMQLERQLEALKRACQDIGIVGAEEPDEVRAASRLRFVTTAAAAKDKIQAAQAEIDQPVAGRPQKHTEEELRRRLAQRMAQLHAALAALVAASADRSRPDYAAAEQAVAAIVDVMPEIVQDGKLLSAGKDDKAAEEMRAQLRTLCDHASAVCDGSHSGNLDDLNRLASTLAASSGKLMFTFKPTAGRSKEQQILAMSSSVNDKASQLLAGVQELAQQVHGQPRTELDAARLKAADAAQGLHTTAQLTAPCLPDPRCQASLVSSANALSSSSQQLASHWMPLVREPRLAHLAKGLEDQRLQLERELDRLKKACVDTDAQPLAEPSQGRELQRLQFLKSVAAAETQLKAAENELKKPTVPPRVPQESAAPSPRLRASLAALHAAIAALAHAARDRENPDYAAADKAINDINRLMPLIVKEAKSQSLDEKARSAKVEDLKTMCEAARGLLTAAHTDQDLNNSAVKLATASGKFLGSYDTPAELDREQRILDLSSSACEKASRLLSGVHQLAAETGGEAGGQLDFAGSQLADRANSLLTTAQITAPCFEDAECRSILQSSTESVQEASKRLAFTWKPLVQDPRFQTVGADLERARQELEEELEKLKKACQLDCGLPPPEDESPLQKKRRLEFTRTAAAAGDNLLQAVKDLDKPTLPQGVPPPHLQGHLARSLAQLHAAVAALLTATHDPAKPDYDAAEQAIHQINVLMPQVVKDTKTLSANKDPEVRDAMLCDVKAICAAARGVCQAAANRNKQLSTKHVASFANSSKKLSYAVSPRPATAAHQTKEQEILELTCLVCDRVAGHVSGLVPLTLQVPAEVAGRLHAAATATAGAAHALRDNAQLTSANLQDPSCRAALLSSIAAVSSSEQTLAGVWTPVTQEPRHAAVRLQLNKEKKGVEEAVEKLKAAVLEDGAGAKSPMRKAPPLPPKRSSTHDMPQAHAHADHQPKRDFNQEFLDQMRLDETRAASEAAVAAEAQKKKEAERQLVAAVDAAVQRIQKAEDHITKVYSSTGEVIPAVAVEQALALQKKMESRLAAAALAAAELLHNDQADFDYAAASKATTALSEQMPNIVTDAISLRGAMAEGERKLFLEDVLAMFDAAKVLAGAAKQDHRRINESAVAFGNKSAKLLYVVSTDIDPAQKKEVLSVVGKIGDGAGQLSMRGEASPSPPVAGAAADLADAAGTLIYSAKLLAPTIQIPECSQSLIHASEDVAQKLRKYTTTFETMEKVDPQASAAFSSESKKLEGLLSSLQEDLRSGKLVKRRVVERIVVEDTPLRQLTCRIIEDAKSRAESPRFPEADRRRWAAHANRLAQAVAALDQACHRARQAPQDANKRLALENAVQELQVLVLMSRPSLDATQNNIVDLTDYVRAVSDDADVLLKECKEGQPELQMVKEHCERIKDNAARVMNPDLQGPADAPEDDRAEVAQFAEDCEKRMKTINSIIQELKDGKTKIDLLEKAARLVETINLLNFATQSDVATTKSVALDAALEELQDLKTGLEDMLTAGGKPARKRVSWSDAGSSRLVAAASRRDAGPRAMAPAVAVYLDDLRANRDLSDLDQKQRAKEHLDKLLQLLQTLTMTSGRHVATWQHTNHPETAAITEQIIKELDDYHSECNGNQKSVLSEVDVSALLRPNATTVQVDQKQLPEKLNQAASKLSSSAGMILQSVQRPESLARSLHAAAAAATHLAAVAATHPHDTVHSQKIDEAAKEMSLQTYNVLKTADFASQDPNNFASRRKLMDACRLLNDAISQLVKTTLPEQPLQQACAGALQRLQLQQGALLTPHAAAAAGYGDALLALASQADLIQKLGDDTPVPRAEFRRNLSHVGGAVAHAVECAAHAAYLLSISDQHKDLAAAGFVDAPRIQSLSEAVQDSCHRINSSKIEMAQEETPILIKHVQDFQQAVAEAQDKLKDGEREELKESSSDLDEAVKQLNAVVRERVPNKAKLTTVTFRVVDSVRSAADCVQRAATAPEAGAPSAEAKARSDDVIKNCRNLNTKMVSLIREVRSSEEQETMTWVTYGASRKAVLDMYEALLDSVRVNGKRAGVIESQLDSEEEMNQAKKSFVQIQLDLANKWLARPTAKAEIATSGEQASRTILSLAEKISEDLKGQEKEEMQHLVTESQQLLTECLKKRDQQKASLLMERLKTLKKAIERGVVSRVVEDFLEGEEPLADLDILADAERDEGKRKFLLERKIAELLAHLGRVTRTARVVAGAGRGGATVSGQLLQTSQQTELLAPMLVKAAQKRVASPDDQAAIEHYQKLLAEYAEQLAHMRELCDQAVDPMDFVQTAGETMQRMREDKTYDNNPQMSVYASTAITKLANRVINVSMSSSDVRKDPELQKALREAKERLKAAVPKPNDRPSRIPDWKVTTAEILRTTGEVESVLGGEMIFKKQQTSDQPIFAAALDLHTAIRSWSAKDNEIVAVAKRMAVLMAKLSDYMNTDRKRDVIFTAKSIVTESQEVADLARKLANECTDVRIKTNLLKVCERIPTISGQLKMLATVKGSLGQQDLKVDQEDMNMLVGNAQNLMLSVQEAVSAAASASVKINSQRGQPRMRWVRNTYY